MGIFSKKKHSSLSIEDYVSALYNNILKRPPDPEGFSTYTTYLKNGGSERELFNMIVGSNEYLSIKNKMTTSETDHSFFMKSRKISAEDYSLDTVISASKTFYSDRAFIKGLENFPNLIGRKKRDVKTIALYYHKMRSGGIERVTAWQVTAWTRMGYRVVLLTDEPAHPDDYPYDDSVRRIVIPAKHMWNDHGEYTARGHALAEALRNEEADVFVTNLAHEICTVWDILVAKSLGIPAILAIHNVFDADFHDGHGLDAAQMRLLGHRYADLTTVLTTMDQTWFTMRGYSTRLVPNPPTFTELPAAPSGLHGKILVWVARVDRHQKQVDHVLQMMPYVLAEHPDARLLIIGTGADIGWAKDLAHSLGIGSRVRFVGHTDDVESFLQNATLHIMTSEFEGFGLALEEAWAYGVPTAMYELPYLELLKSTKGHVSVPQGNIQALARAVCGLLADRDTLQRLGAEARSISGEYRSQPVAEIWRGIFDDLGVLDHLGPTPAELKVSPDAAQIIEQLSAKLFPPIKAVIGYPVPKEPETAGVRKIARAKQKISGFRKFLPGGTFQPLRMIDLTSIPLGDSFMFFSGLYAMLDNGLDVCAPDCVLHTHRPLANICRVLFADFGLTIVEGGPQKVEHPIFAPHPPASNAEWRQTYLGSDWRMDWVEPTDRQKTIGRPGYRDSVRKLAQLFISERLIYQRAGGWKTATPSYIGFRVWWPIALKLGVYPVVFYSMISRSLEGMRQKLHGYIDTEIALDQASGKEPFRGNAAFPTGNSYQTIDAETYKYVTGAVGEDVFTCFVQNDSPWKKDFVAAGVTTEHIPSIEDTLKIIRSAKSVVTCCSFTSHVSQFLRDDFILVMFKDLPENNVNPGANPKVLTYTPACSPCNYLPRAQSKTCPAGYPHCIALENFDFRQKIIGELKKAVLFAG